MFKDGQAKREDLAMGKRISREPNAYKVDSLTALAAQQLEDVWNPDPSRREGPVCHQRCRSRDKEERVRPFPLVGPDDTYDVKKYLEMLVKATEEILIHFGYDWKRLNDWFDPSFRWQLNREIPGSD